MKTRQLKSIDNVLGIASLIAIIASFFYHPLIYEAGILSLTYAVFDMYIAFQTSKPDFIFDLLFIIVILISSFLAPGNNIIDLLSTLMPSTQFIPRTMLARAIGIGVTSPFLVFKIMNLIDSLQEDIVEL
jgi:hypothetical protein